MLLKKKTTAMKITGTKAAVISVNTSYKTSINAKTLVAIFKHNEPSIKWQSHLGVFFSELPDSVIHDFMEENEISPEMMMNVYSSLPLVLQTKKVMSF